MGTIKLEGSCGCFDTLVSNRFIDDYMPAANGEFVKIYLYLLRAISNPEPNISVCHIADVFNHTEKDVIRALKYWEQAGLLDLCFDSDRVLTNIILKPFVSSNVGDSVYNHDTIGINSPKTTEVEIHTSAKIANTNASKIDSRHNQISEAKKSDSKVSGPSASGSQAFSSESSVLRNAKGKSLEKRTYTANEVAAFSEQTEVAEFTYLAEKYLGKTLSRADINSLLYIYDVLEFAPELIEYLLEYCVTNGHKSMRYIEKVALSWAEEGINSVDKARANTDLFNKSCYPVLKAFGLNGRNPGEAEKEFIVKWTNTYGFNMDIILEACNRTIDNIHEPSFKYADSILTNWKKKGIKNLSEVKILDKEHRAKAANTSTDSKNSFNNFEQRSYNYDELEKTLFENM